MSSEAEHGPLQREDALALRRLLRRSFGRGFRLVVIEVATPRIRRRIVEWLRGELEAFDAELLELDVGSLAGENLWAELGERLAPDGVERLLLALHGFQEAVHGKPSEAAGVYRQLNVQRDLFVRDFGCFWVLLIHPYGSRKLQDIAPDFCDFSSLWIQAHDDEIAELRGDGPPLMTSSSVRSVTQSEPQSALLKLASEEIAAGHYVLARDRLTRFELETETKSEDQGHALRLRGRLELGRGDLDAAHRAAERALAWSLVRGEPGKLERADALHLLGSVLEAQGRYSEARSSLEHSIALKQEIYGTQDHPSIARSLHELARVHSREGDTSTARSLFSRALKLVDTPEAQAAISHELASVLRAEGDYSGARRALEQSLHTQIQVYGTELHPAIATTLHSLALVLHMQGDLEAARRYVERSLEIDIEVYGTELHLNVATSRHELAAILRQQGDLEGARRNLERALEIDVEVLGTESHPNVAATLHELAQVLRAQGDDTGARQLLERALAVDVKVFGTRMHPDVAAVLHSLATLLADQGELDEAMSGFEQALDIAMQVRGPEHPFTCLAEVDFAQLLLEQGNPERAKQLLDHARPRLADALGPAHPWVQKADALLAACASPAPE